MIVLDTVYKIDLRVLLVQKPHGHVSFIVQVVNGYTTNTVS